LDAQHALEGFEMTDDLIKRLRVCAAFDPDQAEAADRIEKLEAALLDEITKAYVRGGKWAFANGASFAEYLDKAANDYADARAALGEKKDG
jgi:hypothetical protein